MLKEQTICYCSNFDLSLESWLPVAEHLAEFRSRIKEKLGKSSRVVTFGRGSVVKVGKGFDKRPLYVIRIITQCP